MLGNHYLGLYEKALDENCAWPVCLKKAKELGFDYLEICIDEQDTRIERLYWSDTRIEELRRMTWDAGLPILTMCLSAHRRFPFGSADPNIRRKAYDLMQRAAAFSAQLGIRVIQLAGYDVYYEPSTQESRAAFLAGMHHAADIAAQHQVMLGMEIMDTDFLNSITKYMGYEQQINSPWFRLYPDIGNLTAWGNDVCAELKKGIGSMVAVHIKETKPVCPGFAGQFKCVPFGEGHVDFKSCFAWLETLGYTGPYLIEMWHQPGSDDMKMVAGAKAFIEQKFYSAGGAV